MKYALLLLLLFWFPSVSHAAISFDSQANGSSGTNSASWTHTMGTGAGGVLVVDIVTNGTITAVTYNGVSLTQVTGASNPTGNFYTYYLDSPSTGANTVSVTTSGGSVVTGSSVSYLGAKAGIDNSTLYTGCGTTLPCTVSLTPVAAYSWVVGLFYFNTVTVTSGNANTTIRGQNGSGGLQIGTADTNGYVSGATTMSFTDASAVSANTVAAISLAPISPPVKNTVYTIITSWITWIF